VITVFSIPTITVDPVSLTLATHLHHAIIPFTIFEHERFPTVRADPPNMRHPRDTLRVLQLVIDDVFLPNIEPTMNLLGGLVSINDHDPSSLSTEQWDVIFVASRIQF